MKGRAKAVVVKIGSDTELGKIHRQLAILDDEKSKTPLQERLDVFAMQLSRLILGVCIFVWAINIGHFTDPNHGGLLKVFFLFFLVFYS